MPAVRKKCVYCGKLFWAARSDAKYCTASNGKCRGRERQEDANFTVPVIPRSGVPGVNFRRTVKRWEVRIREGSKWKYIGLFGSMQEAIDFQREVTGDGRTETTSSAVPSVRVVRERLPVRGSGVVHKSKTGGKASV